MQREYHVILRENQIPLNVMDSSINKVIYLRVFASSRNKSILVRYRAPPKTNSQTVSFGSVELYLSVIE